MLNPNARNGELHLLRSLPGFAFHSSSVHSSDSATRGLPVDVSSRLGQRLRELRRERNLTQLRVAADHGIDQGFLTDLEQGKKSITVPSLQLLALGMDLPLSDLLRDL